MNADEHRFNHWGHSVIAVLCVCGLVLCFGCARKAPIETTKLEAPAEPMPLDQAMVLIEERAAWTDHPPINVPRHPAEKYLAGWTIVLDPGHGGEDGGDVDPRADYKRGPTGVREAHMNLRVALLLRRLLTDAGVTVIMTREGDETISLRDRAEVANRADADLFISLHHNAVSRPEANYTSVWYHGPVDSAEPELDVAKYIAHALGRELRTDVAVTSPILDDKLMYRSGFGVLRMCDVPGILLESSFYTNPAEEQRLRDAGYNLREAYAIYVGLCEYAYGGRPTQTTPKLSVDGSQVTLTTTLDPGLPPWWGSDRSRIIESTIRVRVDGEDAPVSFEPGSRNLSAVLPRSAEDLRRAMPPVILWVQHANMFKHHNYPQRFRLVVDADGNLRAEPAGPARATQETSSPPPTTTVPVTSGATGR